MAETVDSLARRVSALERQVEDLLSRFDRIRELGRRSAPVSKVFLSDGRTGSVAEVDYDSDADSIRVTRVR